VSLLTRVASAPTRLARALPAARAAHWPTTRTGAPLTIVGVVLDEALTLQEGPLSASVVRVAAMPESRMTTGRHLLDEADLGDARVHLVRVHGALDREVARRLRRGDAVVVLGTEQVPGPGSRMRCDRFVDATGLAADLGGTA